MTHEVSGIAKIAFWSFNAKSVTYLEVSYVARDIAFFICLEECCKKDGEREKKDYFDNKREIATIVVVTDRGITPGNDFAINFCRDRNVLTGRQAKYVLRLRELETVTKTR